MNEHVRLEDMAELLEAPGHDARRRHVAGCARCRAQLAAYEKFMSAPVERAGTNLGDARQRLRAALEREIRGTPPARARGPSGAGGAAGWFRALLAARRGPAWAAAAAVVVAGLGLVTLLSVLRDRGEDSLRGATPGGEDRVVEVKTVSTAPGTIEFRWRSVPEADAYQVNLLATDLSPIATVSTAGDTAASLRLRELAPGRRSGDLLYGRVVALRMGSPVATSRPITLRAP